MKYGKRFRWNQLAASPLVLLVAAIAVGFLAKAAWNTHEKVVTTDTRLAQARAELAKLQERQADLSQKVAYLSTEEGIQAELRTKYRAVADGESVAVIVDDMQKSSTTSPVIPDIGWWKKFWQMIGF